MLSIVLGPAGALSGGVIAPSVPLEGVSDTLSLVNRAVEDEPELRRHAPGKLARHKRADAPGRLGESGRDRLVLLLAGSIENVAGASVVAYLATGYGDQG